MKVLILGGGYAGVHCALRLARQGVVEVTLVNPTDRFVERIRLHEAAVGNEPRVRSLSRFLAGTGVSLVVGHAIAVDGSAREVKLDDGRVLAFDELVLALGSRAETREGTVGLDPAGAKELAARLPAAKRVLVVGGGLTGVEAAAEIAEAYPEASVTLATRGEAAAGFGKDAQAHVAKVFAALHVTMRPNTDYATLESDFDVTIWTGGFVGASLPEGLEVRTNERGQVLVDPDLRAAGTASIWVCGDLAAYAAPTPSGCKTAGPSASRVADNILARTDAKAFSFISPLFCVSLGRRDGFIEFRSGHVVTGRLAAWAKELICKFTLWAFSLQRHGLFPQS